MRRDDNGCPMLSTQEEAERIVKQTQWFAPFSAEDLRRAAEAPAALPVTASYPAQPPHDAA